MPEIIPRWEWRSFGRRFGDAEARFVALTPGGVQESDEVYLLSAAGDNVKVRAADSQPKRAICVRVLDRVPSRLRNVQR